MGKTINVKEIPYKDLPKNNFYQIWSPTFKHMDIGQIRKKTREYSSVYNLGFFCRDMSTIYLSSI